MTKGYVVRGVHKGASVFSIGGGGDFAEQSEDGFDHPWPFDTLGGASAAVGDMDRSGCTDVRIFAVAEDGTETPLPSYEETLAALSQTQDLLSKATDDVLRMSAEIERLKRREPTQDEATAAANGADEVFVAGWTARRCRCCRRWTFGGPTACVVCAGPLAALEAAERRLLEAGEWREIGPDQWERDSKYAGLSRSNRATALRIEKRRVVDKAKAAKGGTP